MAKSTTFSHLQLAINAIALSIIFFKQANGQSSTMMCTGAMVRNFSPCISFLASGSNTSSPSSECCDSLKDLMSNGQDCLCLIVTGGLPLQIPINQNLAISLPRACRMSGVPIQCKDQSSGQYPPPGLYTPPSGGSFFPQSPPSFTPGGGVVPTLTPPGMRPTLIPSAAHSLFHSALPSLLIIAIIRVVLMIIC